MHEEFSKLFAGYPDAYGAYHLDDSDQRDDGKIKGRAITHTGKVTDEHWRKHLDGSASLGIIPIDAENRARWGCIDIDSYHDFDPGALAMDVARRGLPLAVCRSKSGGAHVFLFLEEPIPAGVVRQFLAEVAAAIGHGNSEIFPKQSHVDYASGDMGNWLNLPYFAAESTVRYGYNEEGQPLALGAFLQYAKERLQTAGSLRRLDLAPVVERGSILADGPPCLQRLCADGFPQGGRNKGLYNLGVMLKKAYPQTWKKEIKKWNEEHMKPPLDADELRACVGSVAKKDYKYTCHDDPIASHCVRSVCLTRPYGVSGGQAVDYANLAKVDCDPPVYFLSADDHRIRLTSVDLLDYNKVKRKAMEVINRVPPAMKQTEWADLLDKMFQTVNLIDARAMPSDEALAREKFKRFLSRGRIIDADSFDHRAIWVPIQLRKEPGVWYFSWVRFVEEFKQRERTDGGVLAVLYTNLGIQPTDNPDIQRVEFQGEGNRDPG